MAEIVIDEVVRIEASAAAEEKITASAGEAERVTAQINVYEGGAGASPGGNYGTVTYLGEETE